MSVKLLEAGAGSRPATMNPGLLFETADVDYVAIDADSRQFPPEVPDLSGLRPSWHRLPIVGMMATINALPFTDNLFDYVTMKNVIGEYSLHLLDEERQGNLDSTKTLSGRSFNETIGGITEVYRILKASGMVVIAEEDTPADPENLADRLHEVGFSEICMLPYRRDLYNGQFSIDPPPHEAVRHIQPDLAWLTARTYFWGINDRLSKDGYIVQADIWAQQHFSASYLMTAVKAS